MLAPLFPFGPYEWAVFSLSYVTAALFLAIVGFKTILAYFVPTAPVFFVLYIYYGHIVAISAVCGFIVALNLAWQLLLCSARSWYRKETANNVVSVDSFVAKDPTGTGGPITSFGCLKVMAMHRSAAGNRSLDNRDPSKTKKYPLKSEESPHVAGLFVSVRAPDLAATTELPSGKGGEAPLVIGTIRMGFGHHRIAYAAASWGADGPDNRPVLFHDLLSITPSEEADLIKNMDKLYSKGSRLTSELGGAAEKAWGAATKSGDADSLRATYQMGELVTPLLGSLDKESPIVCSHTLVACAAVAAGFKHVINLVIDNHAQWFVVAPGCLNLVQGPGNYRDLRRMGVPEENVRVAGHWCPRDLVENIDKDCDRRIKRAAVRKNGKNSPLRLLLPVGGAGAQRRFVTKLLAALAPSVKAGDVQIFLNAGDHSHMKDAFAEVLDAEDIKYAVVNSTAGVYGLRDTLLAGNAPEENVTLLAFDDYFPAVATTDILCRAVDVLVCKPSELAFYCLPKIMIRRVGDHEAYSATRASELGDGTAECRTVESVLDYVRMMTTGEGDVLTQMCEYVKTMGKAGIYDGCRIAIKVAREMVKEEKKMLS